MADPGYPVEGGGATPGGGADVRRRHFLVKIYAKMEELRPVGVGVGWGLPESANVYNLMKIDQD